MRPDTGICRLCRKEIAVTQVVRNYRCGQCPDCGALSVLENPSSEELRAIYGAAYFSKTKYAADFALNRELTRRWNLVTKHVPMTPGKTKLLEVGCATGEFLSFVPDTVERWGIDVSSEAIDFAKQRLQGKEVRLQAGRLEDVQLPENYFDVIVMWDVVEHLPDPAQVCEQAMKLLRPGGFLLLSTPDQGSFMARVMKNRWAFMTPPEHLCFFNKKAFSALAQQRLSCNALHWSSRGKWTSVGFLAYKLGRVFKVAKALRIETLLGGAIGKAPIYVPTGDVAYGVLQKKP